MKEPNELTLKSFSDYEKGVDLTKSNSIEELFENLELGKESVWRQVQFWSKDHSTEAEAKAEVLDFIMPLLFDKRVMEMNTKKGLEYLTALPEENLTLEVPIKKVVVRSFYTTSYLEAGCDPKETKYRSGIRISIKDHE